MRWDLRSQGVNRFDLFFTFFSRWHLDLTELRKLEQFVDDASFVRNIAQIKQENKERFAAWVERTHGLKLNTAAMFDIHVKRIHEYKVTFFSFQALLRKNFENSIYLIKSKLYDAYTQVN